MNIVKQVIAKNQKRSAPATLCVTDRGIDFEDSSASVFHHVPIREMFKIVPGTIVSKSGKKCTVAIIIHYDESAELDQQPCHVFQCAHRQDAALMHEAGKRMWRDHLFSNLLDVSTEEGQDGFDSFMIRQDMETAATRCTELIQRDEIVTNDRCSMLIRSELDNFSPLTLLPGSL